MLGGGVEVGDEEAGRPTPMARTRKLLGAAGATARHFFSHTPICCPSRATLLSGRFVQNNRVDNNAAKGCMRMNTSRDDNPEWWLRSVPVALARPHVSPPPPPRPPLRTCSAQKLGTCPPPASVQSSAEPPPS